MKREPTMEDVARACGYSRAAVSMALKGDKTIPEKTRARIAATAEKLGYKPNPLISALMSLQRKRRHPSARATTAIAFLSTHPTATPWRQARTYVSMFEGARTRAAEIGYSLEDFNLAAPGMTPGRMRDILLARHIHAVVVAPLPRRSTAIEFDFSGFAVVGLGMSVNAPIIERVANDHYQSAVLAVRKCAELGYQRVGLVLSRETSHRLDNRWLGGYRFAMAQYLPGVRLNPLMPDRIEDLPAAVAGWERAEKPEVVILGNSEKSLLERFKADTVNLAVESANDRCTGIFQDYHLLGAVAVEHAIAKLQTNSFGVLPVAHLHLVEGVWVPGTTATGPRSA